MSGYKSKVKEEGRRAKTTPLVFSRCVLKLRITQLEEELAVYKQGTQQTAHAKAAKRRKQSQKQQRAAFKAHEQQQAAGSGSGSSSSSSSSSSRRGPGKR